MNSLLKRFKDEASRMAAELPEPRFYTDCATEIDHCKGVFFEHPLMLRLQEDVLPFLYDDYGHGIEHSKKVAVEAGAVVLVETRRQNRDQSRRQALCTQMAGLLHDVCRLESDHAAQGAALASKILASYPLDPGELARISYAISSHEAFTPVPEPPDEAARLAAGALYDADKFRWGPDNFSTTLWEICDYEEWDMHEILNRFPKGIETIRKIENTFRTDTGRTYGPEFIEIGLELGRLLHEKLVEYVKHPQTVTL